jgi:hypothetical protein
LHTFAFFFFTDFLISFCFVHFFFSFCLETTTTSLLNSPTKSKSKVVVNVQQSSEQQKLLNFNNCNNVSRLKSNQQQHNYSSNIFDKNSKALAFAHCNKIEDSRVSHQSHNNKMVAKQEIEAEQPDVQNENDEDFKYGPGFVSKLRYRYLSLTLRQSNVSKQRPSLLELRRSTSLNNLLDDGGDDDEEESEDVEEQEEIIDTKANATNGNGNSIVQHENQKNHNFKNKTESYQPAEPHMRASRSIEKNLNLKRARSVEAILRYDHSSWERDIKKEIIESKSPTDVTIEDKIQSARERTHAGPPKRLTSLNDDERPPPGICKQTMRIFEASANKKRNLQTRPIGQEIASKVAIFKSQEKPAITAKKPNIVPRTSSPKPINHFNNNANMNNCEKYAKFTKEKAVLPKLDINIIKNNLETKSNGSWSPADNKESYRINYSPANSDSSLSSTPNILSPYRNSMSPQLNETSYKKHIGATAADPTSPIITSLSNKLSNLHMDVTSTPKSYKTSNLLKTLDDSTDIMNGDKESSDNKINNNSVISDNSETGSEFKSVNENLHEPVKTQVTLTPKVFNKNNIIPKVNHENSELNNGEVKSVKENLVITKPTTKPPPPPPPTSAMKTQLSRDNIDNNKNSSFVASTISTTSTTTTTTSVKSSDSDSSSTAPAITASAVAVSSTAPKWTVKKKSWSSQADDQPSNSIVFNFSDRKDVPDYIEHDGLILRRKRELPKVSYII